MSVFVIETTLSIALFVFWVQILFAGRRSAYLDSFNVAIMSGFIGMGIIAYFILPTLGTTVELIPYYSPHAYNLIIWGAMGLVLRNIFPPKHLILAFIMSYAIDELLWNGLAVAYFWGQWDVLHYLSLSSWWVFIGLLVGAGVVCYLIVRPKFKVNVTWITLPAFGIFWAWGLGMPVLAATNIASLNFEQTAYRLAWEILWQFAFWGWFYTTARPKEPEVVLFMDRPSVG